MSAQIDTATIKQSISLHALASRSVKLHKVAATEYAGPCPKCGGTDRLHVHGTLFMCRQCHPRWGDAIEFVQWSNGVDFMTATQMLAGDPLPTMSTHPVNVQRREEPARPTWNAPDVTARLATYQRAMDASPAAAYLADRGFCPDTWHAYGLGYRADYNALVMPWYRGGQLVGLNYRRLGDVEKGRRFISETGSVRSGLLFGAQALCPNLHHLLPNGTDPLRNRSLFIVEGELNCASLYQAAYGAHVDVLSTGAENNTIPDSFLSIAARYRACIVWKDKALLAKAEAKRIVGAAAYWSELADGRELDANDHLRHGTLGVLVAHILRQATPADGQEALRWDLWDGGIG
jgi:hypothetical protein